MKIWFISDTHCLHDYLIMPELGIDVVIHCGDEANKSDPVFNEIESRKFFEWYRYLPILHKIFVPGNHSTAIQAGLIRPEEYPEIKFLIHEETVIDGIRIFGTPYTPTYGTSWAYMKKRNRMDLVWQSVPECDILVTHGPPKGILDLTINKKNKLVQVGCKSLYNRVMQIQPKIHAFGHVHDEGKHNYGIYQWFNTDFINCACWDHKKTKFYNGILRSI